MTARFYCTKHPKAKHTVFAHLAKSHIYFDVMHMSYIITFQCVDAKCCQVCTNAKSLAYTCYVLFQGKRFRSSYVRSELVSFFACTLITLNFIELTFSLPLTLILQRIVSIVSSRMFYLYLSLYFSLVLPSFFFHSYLCISNFVMCPVFPFLLNTTFLFPSRAVLSSLSHLTLQQLLKQVDFTNVSGRCFLLQAISTTPSQQDLRT